MYTLQEYIEQRDTSKHKCKTEQEAVNEAIDILMDNRFTGMDVVTLITANKDVIEAALDKKFYPEGKPNKRPQPRG